MKQAPLNTPCIGICSTVYGDDVCRGCKRFSPEIIDWNTFDTIQKQQVFDRLGQMISTIVETKILVQNAELLRERLDFLGIRYREEQSAYCDIYYLLRAGASQIKQSQDFGFVQRVPYKDFSLPELFEIIEQEYLQLAQQTFIHHQNL